MKVNKLKAFFIIAFISLLIPLAYIPSKTVFSESQNNKPLTYPPLLPPESYSKTIEHYNYCGVQNSTPLLSYKTSNSHFVLSSTREETYLSVFSPNDYRKHTTKILSQASLAAVFYQDYLIITTGDYIYYFDKTISEPFCLKVQNCYNIQTIDSTIYYFCQGDNNIYSDKYGTFVFCEDLFFAKCGEHFVFSSQKQVYITDFKKNIYFDIDQLISIQALNNNLYFAAIIDNTTIITCLKDFEILWTTVIEKLASRVFFSYTETTLNITITENKTYLYTLCSHGDIISSRILCEEIVYNESQTTYQTNNLVYTTINNKQYIFEKEFFDNIIFAIDNYIVFCDNNFFSPYKNDIFIAKLN